MCSLMRRRAWTRFRWWQSYCRMAVVLKKINVIKEKPWTLKNGKKGALGAKPHPLQIHLRGQGLEHPTGKWSHESAFLGSVARYSKVWPEYLIYHCDPRDSSYTLSCQWTWHCPHGDSFTDMQNARRGGLLNEGLHQFLIKPFYFLCGHLSVLYLKPWSCEI